MKDTIKRIASVALAIVMCTGVIIGLSGTERINAEPVKPSGMYWGATYDEAVEHLEAARKYAEGKIDPINGEIILVAEQKANVLSNVKKNKQKLTILEIVPYELMSVYSIFCPDARCETIMNAYGDLIFGGYQTVKDNTCVLADGGIENEDFFMLEGYDYNQIRSKTENYIADADHPIEIVKNGDTYSSNIMNYFLNNLLKDHRDSGVFKYFNNDNVEVKVVVPGLTTNEELMNILLGDGDPVDFIYFGSYVEQNLNFDNNGIYYRNLFFSQGEFDEEGNYIIDDETKNDMYNLLKNGVVDDNKYHTGVYKKLGDNNYVEYKLSELFDAKVSYESYSKIGPGETDADYRSNDLSWEMVKTLMTYIFGNYNTNYLYTPTDEEGMMGTPQQQRVSCIFQLDTRNGGQQYFYNQSTGCDNNVGKLYYLLAKSTDQSSDKSECVLTHPDGASEGTHTIYGDIATYYYDPDYLMKYFDETDESGNKYYNSNGVTTAAYKENVIWPLWYSSDYIHVHEHQTVWSWTGRDGGNFVNYTYSYADNADLVTFNINLDETQNLFHTSTIIDGLYIVYNSVIGVDGQKSRNLFDSGLNITHSDGGARREGVYKRIEDAVGVTFTQFNVVNYLLGVDESDFLIPPDAEFLDVERAANENAFVDYLYEEDRDAENYEVKYMLSDMNGKMTSAKLVAKYKVIEGGLAVSKEKTVKTYAQTDIYGLEEFFDSYTISADDAELLEALHNGTLEFELSVTNSLTYKEHAYSFTDTAYLYLKYRDIKDLD